MSTDEKTAPKTAPKTSAKATDPVKEEVQPTPAASEAQTPTTTPAAAPQTDQSAPPVPSVGRVVHYVIDKDLPPLAALVTAVPEDVHAESAVSLVIFKEHLQMFRKNVAYDAKAATSNTWGWPPRV